MKERERERESLESTDTAVTEGEDASECVCQGWLEMPHRHQEADIPSYYLHHRVPCPHLKGWVTQDYRITNEVRVDDHEAGVVTRWCWTMPIGQW